MRRLVTWKVKKKHVAQNKDCFCGYSFTKKTFLKSKNHGVDKAAVATAEFKICAIVTPSWAKVGYFSVCDGLYSAPLRLCPIIGDVSSEARHLSLGHLLSFRRTVVRLHNLATKIQTFYSLDSSFNQTVTWFYSYHVIGCKLRRRLEFLLKFIRWCNRKRVNALSYSTY